jgi:reverse gyrase
MYVFNETYSSAYEIPSPVRKWLIERYNKQKEKENKKTTKEPSLDQPLSAKEKERFKKNYK